MHYTITILSTNSKKHLYGNGSGIIWHPTAKLLWILLEQDFHKPDAHCPSFFANQQCQRTEGKYTSN